MLFLLSIFVATFAYLCINMKNYFTRGVAAALTMPVLLLSGCIADEPLNKECDILSAYLHVQNPELFFYNASDSVVSINPIETELVFRSRPKLPEDFREQIKNLAPVFSLTPGATIEPANGSYHDFTQGPVTYTITSEDGQWTRQYKVFVKVDTDVRSFSFEDPFLIPSSKTAYYDWAEFDASGDSLKIWASGNPGFTLTNSTSPSENFPTAYMEDGYSGKGVRLVTRSTGILGSMFKMPIAAGNLFIGEFDLRTALKDPLGATRFGRPVGYKPVRLEGYYKYQMGKAEDKIGEQPVNNIDEASIYAVFFNNRDEDGNEVKLNGSNVLTSERLVARAIAPDLHPTTEWTKFSVDFTFLQECDDVTLANRGYSMAVVFSSSKYGAYFEGAVGSELCVDEVRIISEDDELKETL